MIMDNKQTNKPQVYVGTFKKYNSGNLTGKWLTLTDYPTYEEFIDACDKLHSDENSPELMIQDTKCMPDGVKMQELPSKEDFDDVMTAYNESLNSGDVDAIKIIEYSEKSIVVIGETYPIRHKLKNLNGKYNPYLKCGAGWIFPKAQREKIEALLDRVTKQEPQVGVSDKEAAVPYKQWLQESKFNDYYYFGAVRIEDEKIGTSYLAIPRLSSIETDLYFSDEGEPYKHYLKLLSDKTALRNDFLKENLSKIQGFVNNIRERINADGCLELRYLPIENHIEIPYGYNASGILFTVDSETITTILKGAELSLEEAKKRLTRYLNRWGLSKIHLHTYYENR